MKPKSRGVSRPPSCARPTISSLRKMNRTFSLNNVADIGNPTTTAAPNPLPSMVSQNITSTNGTNSPMFSLNQPSVSSFHPINANMSCINEESLRNSNKLSSKYASSNFLNESYSSTSQQPFNMISYATARRSNGTPRRRTPRNAEEFLLAAGVADPESYLTKGFYVGSMLNLTELSKASGNNIPDKASLMLDQSNSSFNSLQRRNSVHQENMMTVLNGTSNRVPKIYNSVANQRSATTAILVSNNNDSIPSHPQEDNRELEYSVIRNNEIALISSSNPPTSGAVSDSSSASPSSLLHNRAANPSSTNNMGPLMRAVSNLSPAINTKINHTSTTTTTTTSNNSNNEEDLLEDDEYDDYEYLERNLGAEPASIKQMSNNNPNNGYMTMEGIKLNSTTIGFSMTQNAKMPQKNVNGGVKKTTMVGGNVYGGGVGTWDLASVNSNNSVVSGWYLTHRHILNTSY